MADVMTWFPRKKDYEVAPVVMLDETIQEKLARLIGSIETAQHNIKEVVDEECVPLEQKIYRTMDIRQDLEELTQLHKECEANYLSATVCPEDIKKAKVGLINLKAYLNQVDCMEFALAIVNQYLFKVGSCEGFGVWLEEAEKRISLHENKPPTFDACLEYEQSSCKFLKETVKANKHMSKLTNAAEGVKTNVDVQEELAKLSERYYVLCKKAEARVKNMQGLLFEWKRLDELLAPRDPQLMDDLQVKQFVIFLRTYAAYFS